MHPSSQRSVWSTSRKQSGPRPPFRRLRGYAFDPSLSTQLETALVNEITFRIPWEEDGREMWEERYPGQPEGPPDPVGEGLFPGPVGEYVEVVDYDPATGCFYEPIDLNAPHVLAQDGLAPSEGNPRFHQQMVYAVAMTTIRNFERALGRFALWAPRIITPSGGQRRDEFVRRLRIYPHALREANAYYSPRKKALLFGYFPAAPSTSKHAGHFPGGMVFTCLSHDIIAHETTHALLDGMHRRYVEPTNPDALAFHEAFADIVALFQHFSFPEVLRHQIALTRGDLRSQSQLGRLAQQFGRAIGQHGALRDAIGTTDPDTGEWKPLEPDPDAYHRELEPHARGAILVAAVFDAFLAIYKQRIADLLRIASAGTGMLAEGALHPDLVNRLAAEASTSAQHVLNMCIRALDYVPPVDLTFGEYLRAIITADSDLVPEDTKGYRVAFIEAFRRRGIYPRDIRTLSVDALRWSLASRDERALESIRHLAEDLKALLADVRTFATTRRAYHDWTQDLQERVHQLILSRKQPALQTLCGDALCLGEPPRGKPAVEGLERDGSGLYKFEVHSVRSAQRVGPDGQLLNHAIVCITQKRKVPLDEERSFDFRGGATLIFDLESRRLQYVIRKGITNEGRLEQQRAFRQSWAGSSLRGTYLQALATYDEEPFALLHRPAEGGFGT